MASRKTTKKTTEKVKARPASPVTPTKDKKAHLISSKLSYKGKVFDVYTDTVIEPTGHRNVRDVIPHNASVAILAADDSVETGNPADPIIIFERQYRHAPGQFL